MDRIFKFGIVAIVFLSISLISFLIVLGLGWYYNREIDSDDHIFTAGIAVTTVPIFALMVLGIFLPLSAKLDCLAVIFWVILVIIVISTGIFEIIGGVILLVAGGLGESSQAIAFGISAGVFGLVSGAAFFCSMIVFGVCFGCDSCSAEEFCCCCSCDCFRYKTKTRQQPRRVDV